MFDFLFVNFVGILTFQLRQRPLDSEYSGPSVILAPVVRIPGWSGQFFAISGPIFPVEIVLKCIIIIIIIYWLVQHLRCKEFYFSME